MRFLAHDENTNHTLPNLYLLMYNTEGVSAIATVTELRMETADILDVLGDVPVICVQRNNTPEAAMLSMDTYRALLTELERQGTSLEEM